jgi:hypothetical protein
LKEDKVDTELGIPDPLAMSVELELNGPKRPDEDGGVEELDEDRNGHDREDPREDVALWVELVDNEKKDADDGKDDVAFVVELVEAVHVSIGLRDWYTS